MAKITTVGCNLDNIAELINEGDMLKLIVHINGDGDVFRFDKKSLQDMLKQC